jgi:hypothetical protein
LATDNFLSSHHSIIAVKKRKENNRMKSKTVLKLTALVVAITMGVAPVSAAVKKIEVPEAPLTAQGEKLLSAYADMLKTAQAEVAKTLPNIDEQKKEAFLKAYQTEATATALELKTMREQGGKGVKDKDAAAKAHAAIKESLALAKTNALVPAKAMLTDLSPFLSSDKLDAQLAKCVVLKAATPRGLAVFAQQGKEQEALVEKLLADSDLMKQMVVADGAKDGQYGRAMQIYTEIQKASPRAKEGVLQRLALGTSLEQAVPVAQTNPQAQTNAPTVVDPVKRYLHFEKAYLDGELDPAFKALTTWDCRFVTNGDETEEVLTWGREMLRNYRPDHIATSDYRWRYVKAVKTDVQYGSKEQVNDIPTLHNFQNIINTGGVCGRRAFFGRFILRCFGLPTLARPQKGHATLVHWTPEGWVINLGAGWGWGWLKDGQQDVDFLAMTQARKVEKAYVQVLRAKWMGDVLGEKDAFGFNSEVSGFWNGVALYRQQAIIEESKAVALAAVGTDIGEANVSKEKDVIETVTLTDADRKVVIGQDQTITIPAVACTFSTNNTEKIIFMKSFKDGLQMHYSRNGKPEAFEYTFDAPAAGTYALSASVVTVSPNQHLLVAANDAKESVDIALPYTLGKWEQTPSVEVSLAKGKNVLKFTRNEPARGLTIKQFTLKPAK